MARPLPGVDSLGDLAGKRVLVRSDLNVPLEPDPGGGARITDDGRIRASVPQIRSLLDAGAHVVVCAHLGRPKGAPHPKYSLAPVATRLGSKAARRSRPGWASCSSARWPLSKIRACTTGDSTSPCWRTSASTPA